MNSTHFPIIIMSLFLIVGVSTPVIKKRFDNVVKFMLMGTFGVAIILSALTFLYVQAEGPFTYNFGNWSRQLGIEFAIDGFSALLTLLIVSVSAIVVLFSLEDIEHEVDSSKTLSYYTIVFTLIFAMVGITFSNDLFNIYVFMEILSLTSCGIISIKHKKVNFLASFRYLILNTLGSISFMFGIALLYMVTGHLNIVEVNNVIADVWQYYPTNILLAVGFMFTGLGIKAAMFPLHVWLPDAHSSAPTPSSALLSGLVVKVYVFTMAKIIFNVIGVEISQALDITTFLTYFAALSMIMGSIFAIGQKDIKRMLAYSSVAQIGYMFLGIGLATEFGLAAGFFHIFSHAMMKAALFLSAGTIIYKKNQRNITKLDGIGYEMPVTMTVFTIAALGMVGIPGIIGFMSKFYLGVAVLEAGQSGFIIVILLSSFLNAIYYLPIIISAFIKEDKSRIKTLILDKIPVTMLIPLVLLGFSCVLFGFFPNLLMDTIENVVPTFLN
ncbi:monovalent cation/H+ antiporter subunit D family protein [Proteinivorax hydrogeniformans]|uniref:Monovalent cation/H+ antiporter subunit D family protein n=2 Tax=Proteinivorax TaxID=1491776 RepID=A0AAU7VKG4_9FIRM